MNHEPRSANPPKGGWGPVQGTITAVRLGFNHTRPCFKPRHYWRGMLGALCERTHSLFHTHGHCLASAFLRLPPQPRLQSVERAKLMSFLYPGYTVKPASRGKCNPPLRHKDHATLIPRGKLKLTAAVFGHVEATGY